MSEINTLTIIFLLLPMKISDSVIYCIYHFHPFPDMIIYKNRNWNYATNQIQNTVLATAYICGCLLLNLYNVRDQDTVHLIYYKALWDTLIWLVDCCSQVSYPCRSWQWQLIQLIKPCYFHTVEFYTRFIQMLLVSFLLAQLYFCNCKMT